MAHVTDVNQVPKEFEVRMSEETVTDPVCGKDMARKDSRSVVFRGDQEFHFCSRECRDKFLKAPNLYAGPRHQRGRAA